MRPLNLGKLQLWQLIIFGALVCSVLSAETTASQEDTAEQAPPALSSLTETERSWLREHPVIRTASDPDWPPIEFANADGEFQGMVYDYLELIEERLGIRFEPARQQTWKQVYTKLQRWELDMATCVAKTPLRTQFWTFTAPYLSIPIVIFTRSEVTYIPRMEDLVGKKVAVAEGYAIQEWMRADYPDIELTTVRNPPEGLEKLDRGEIFAYLDNMLVIGDLTARKRILDVKIAGQTPYRNDQRMAVRKDWPILAQILQKALDDISDAERAAIYKRWVPVRYEYGFDYTLLWQVMGGFGLIFLGLLYWNRRLGREVRQRTEAEQRLRHSEERLGVLVEQMDAIIWSVDAELRITSVRGAGMALMEVSGEKTVGKHLSDISIGQEEPLPIELINSIKQAVDGTAASYEGAGFGGIWLTQAEPLRDARGVLSGCVAVSINVTEQRQAERELLKRRHFLESVLMNAPDAIVTLDAQSRVIDWNRGAENMFGYRPSETLGKRIDQLILPTRLAGQAHLYPSKIDSNSPMKAQETVRYHKDGTALEVIATAAPIFEEEVRTGMVVIFTDITPLKHAEAEVRLSEHMLARIINAMPSILVGVDAELAVTHWNDGAHGFTGLSAEKVRMQPIEKAMPFMDARLEHIRQAITEQKIIRQQKVTLTLDDDTSYHDVTIYPLAADGAAGAVIRIDNITERVRLEEMMIQSEKMLSIGGLAAGMAHEINNPLAGILQNTAVLKNRLQGEIKANRVAAESAGTTLDALRHYAQLRKLPDMLTAIESSGRRAAEIVKNMLSFARKSDRVIADCHMDKLLDQTVELVESDFDMKKRYDFKRIEICRHYKANVPPVPCEGSKIQQVFLNILRNGAEAMAESTAADSPPRFDLHIDDDERWVRVEIKDNGPGIPERIRKRIFEPFYTTKVVGKGTGLGLSVSYFIITEDHGGKLAVDTRPGEGTRFIIRLLKAAHSNTTQA